ncbi:demethoxyubiquinone hydroxylase family protein [Legionella sp. CNM-1927-20]|uniref:demethoxyubiquinone hydroxylase family protein n=1 Tax=Legionella sp. CNM-1927-20 TaxID=3422221 RepID=UPI00403B2704
MAKTVNMGMNHTGTQMSPMDTKNLLDFVKKNPADIEGDTSKLVKERARLTEKDNILGSIPLPGSAKGAVKTGLDKLLGNQPELLLDKLGERLAYERGGIRLYEAALAKATAFKEKELIKQFQHIRNEEAEHMFLLVDTLKQLGADPTVMTPSADVAGVVAQGAMQVLTDPRTNMAHCLNALLTLELGDNAGWELLIDLLKTSKKTDIAKTFQKAFVQEQEHVKIIKRLYKKFLN